jgi:hypothetical protein
MNFDTDYEAQIKNTYIRLCIHNISTIFLCCSVEYLNLMIIAI